jgi:hypothetical protein
MHFGVLMAGLPSLGNHGGALTCWAVISEMVAQGHKVTVISLYDTSSTNPYLSSRVANAKGLVEMGVNLEYIEYQYADLITRPPMTGFSIVDKIGRRIKMLRELFNPTIEEYVPWYRLRPQVKEILDRIKPDAIFCYHFEALAASHEVTEVPRMACVVDLLHLPALFRWSLRKPELSWSYVAASLYVLESSVIHPAVMRTLMNNCQSKADFGYHYAQWFQRNGVKDCMYLRTPTPDALGQKEQNIRKGYTNAKPRILMVGDLTGTATRSGISIFARETLPALEHLLGPQTFEVHLVGRGQVDASLAPFLDRPSVVFRGPIEPADDEFLSADVILVPTNMTLGVRVRIIVAFSFGCCVVAHKANAAGIPELHHGENCLMASTGHDLAEQIALAIRDHKLNKQLGENARQSYETYFSEHAAGGVVVQEIERIADKIQRGVPLIERGLLLR